MTAVVVLLQLPHSTCLKLYSEDELAPAKNKPQQDDLVDAYHMTAVSAVHTLFLVSIDLLPHSTPLAANTAQLSQESVRS